MSAMTLDLPRRFPWPTLLSVAIHGCRCGGGCFIPRYIRLLNSLLRRSRLRLRWSRRPILNRPRRHGHVVEPVVEEPDPEPEPEVVPEPPKTPVVIHKPEPKPKPKPKPKTSRRKG
ncbi:TonB N-terminal domain-containing protein [Pseudomonas aeruginosa]